jgi:UDP-3-O-[3-hydroxymyristoyl] glucosamine N-acyltransferase
VTFGKEVTLVEPSNLYECSIENGCFVRPFVEIQKGVRIGNNAKVQSHTFLFK